MPTYMQGYRGSLAWLPAAGLFIFFVLRAAGRFVGSWLLSRMKWTSVLVLLGGAIFACFLGTIAGGKPVGALLLPLSGLFMSMIYPTINSKGISCFPRNEHGSVAGVILFFTAVAAAFGPLAMAKVSDAAGDLSAGFQLAAVFAGLLFAGLLYNWWREPAAARLVLASRSTGG
jgi:fucose permease